MCILSLNIELKFAYCVGEINAYKNILTIVLSFNLDQYGRLAYHIIATISILVHAEPGASCKHSIPHFTRYF